MKVLQLNTVCGAGSIGKIAVGIHNIVKAHAGDESVILYGRDGQQDNTDFLYIGSKLDMYAHVLTNFVSGRNAFASKRMTRRMIEEIKKQKPDVIHLHNLHGFYLNIELLFDYLKGAGIPVVWTLHDCWSFTGHCAYYDYEQCEKWKTGCYKCPLYRKAYPYALFKDNSKENYQRKKAAFTGVPNLTLVTPSLWLKEQVENSFLKDYPIEVIFNGIDLNTFSLPEQLKQNDSKKKEFVIMGAANVWEKRKGLDYFYQLAGMLEQDEKIILVGLTKRQIDKLPPNIIGIQRTDSIQELAALYQKAGVFVNPTLEDISSLTNMEALACGTPVVTFATGGAKEVPDKNCGIIVPKGDTQALLDAIRQVKKAPFSPDACRNRVKLFDQKVNFELYYTLYQKVTCFSGK